MKKPTVHPSFLQIIYLVIFFILFFFIIYTPTLISGPVRITEKFNLQEETIEGSLLGILFIVSIMIFTLYKKDVDSHKEQIHIIKGEKKRIEERLQASDQYIGKINVQIEEIQSIFNKIEKYPLTKNEFKTTFSFFGKRIQVITNSEWVLLRIIHCNTQRTISEHFESRVNTHASYPHVSNKLILEDQPLALLSSVIYHPKNLNILVVCIVPVEKISPDERIFIQSIIDELTKLFVITHSIYYKNVNMKIQSVK